MPRDYNQGFLFVALTFRLNFNLLGLRLAFRLIFYIL